jgi:hypothetical protein
MVTKLNAAPAYYYFDTKYMVGYKKLPRALIPKPIKVNTKTMITYSKAPGSFVLGIKNIPTLLIKHIIEHNKIKNLLLEGKASLSFCKGNEKTMHIRQGMVANFPAVVYSILNLLTNTSVAMVKKI